jgi:hypothetical protein
MRHRGDASASELRPARRLRSTAGTPRTPSVCRSRRTVATRPGHRCRPGADNHHPATRHCRPRWPGCGPCPPPPDDQAPPRRPGPRRHRPARRVLLHAPAQPSHRHTGTPAHRTKSTHRFPVDKRKIIALVRNLGQTGRSSEPGTAGLRARRVGARYSWCSRLPGREGEPLVVASYNMEITAMCDRTAHVRDGEIGNAT